MLADGKTAASDNCIEKGLADRRGWHGEILRMPGIQASCLHPFAYAPLGEGGHNSGEQLWLSFGPC